MATGQDFNDARLIADGVTETCDISISFRDVFFKFEVVANRYYEFRCFSDGDTVGHLYNQNKQKIAENDDGGGNSDPLIIYLANYTGFVYFKVNAYNSYSTINNVVVSAKGLSVETSKGSSFENAIEIPDDGTVLDQQLLNPLFQFVYFKFTIEPNAFYTFQTYGNIDLIAYLFDQNKREIATDDDSGQGNNPLLTYKSTGHGFLYVAVKPYSSGGIGSFQTELTKIEIPTRPGDSFGNPIPLELNTWRNESFFPYNNGVYFIASLTVRKKYTVRINKEYDADIFFDAGESFQYLDYDFRYEDGNYQVYDFTATSPNIYIIAHYSRIPTENGLPFDLFLEETDLTIPKSIEIVPSYDVVMKLGETIQFTAIVKPDEAINANVLWFTNRDGILDISEDGLVTAIGYGNVVIEAEIQGTSLFSSVYVEVKVHDGDGTFRSPYLISSVEDLANINLNLDSESYYKQTSDIDLTGIDWEGIGTDPYFFNGYYDGSNFRVIGLTINKLDNDFLGLFKQVQYGNVENLILQDVNIVGGNYTGALVGKFEYGVITNCHVKGIVNIQGAESVGGLVGFSDGNVLYCSSEGNISGENRVGGLLGVAEKDTENSSSDANVTCRGQEAGGLIGRFSGYIANCYATGDVRGEQIVGGLIGLYTSNMYSGSRYLINCYAIGNVYGKHAVGGLIGQINDSRDIAYIENSYVLSKYIQDTSDEEKATTSEFGSLFGRINGTNFVTHESYAVDDLEFTTTRTTNISFNQINSGTITREQSTDSVTYSGWDFDTVWTIDENTSRPILLVYVPYVPPPIPEYSEGTSSAVLLSNLVFKRMDDGGVSG